MKLYCPNCGNSVKSNDIDLGGRLAKCAVCDSVFSFADEFEAAPSGYQDGSGYRTRVGKPRNYTLDRTPTGGLVITRKWFSPAHLFIAFFTLFWNGFMVVWFGIAITQGETIMALFGSIHGLVGLGLGYFTLAGFVNRTVISVDYLNFKVKHTPLPWPGNIDMASSDLKQLYSKEQISHSRKGGTRVSYEVHAVTRSGEHVKLVSGLSESEQALFLEQEIEKNLRIEDQPVRGELNR